MSTHGLAALALLAALAGPAAAQRQPAVLGARLRLELRGSAHLTGELLAVERDTLWVLASPGGMHGVAVRDVVRARVPRPGPTAGTILAWTLVGGLVSGALLTGACASLEDSDGCGGVLPGVVLVWGVFGGASAAIAGSRWRDLDAHPTALTPYARFPQGMPEGFGR